MSFFKKIDISVPKDKQDDKIVDPFIYRDLNPEIYFVTDSINRRQISFIQNALQKKFGQDSPNFAVLYAFVYAATEKDITSNITSFVSKYTIDYSKYIPENSKIICIGRSIYSFTMETTFNASAFYPYEYVETYFFHPPTKSYVFPVDDFFFFTSFEKKRFLDNFNMFFFFKQLELAYNFTAKKVRLLDLKVEIVDDPNKFLLEMKDKVTKVAWDLETDGLIFYKNKVICLTMSFDGRTGYYLDFSKIDKTILSEFFKDKYQIGANLKFDCKFLRNLGVENVKIDFDTLNAGHCLNETTSNSLSSHGWRYTYYGGHEIELQKYKREHPKLSNYSQIPRSILSQYATKDAIICFQVYEKQLQLLKQDMQLYQYYFNHVVPNLNLFVNIELDGVCIDWDYLVELNKKFEEKKESLENEIFELMGFKVNLSSNKDLGIALEKKLNFPDLGQRSKAGFYLTNEEVLNEWAKLGYPVAKKLVEYRSTCNQINTFIGSEKDNNAYWQYRNTKTGTVHPAYMVMLAQSHRNKCYSPNLQQVPKRTQTAKDFRRIFMPPSPDYYIAEGDFAAFQMRIAAVLSQDQNLMDAFTKYGGDVHSMTAIAIFHNDMTIEDFMKVKKESPYKEQRVIAKTTNFAFLFGGSARSFTESTLKVEWTYEYCMEFLKEMKLNIYADDPFQEAGEYIRNSFFKKYPKLQLWHEQCHAIAKETGMIRSVYGARRLLPRLKYIGQDTDKKTVSEDQNVSKNSTVQNFEIIVITRAMREIYDFMKSHNMKSRIFGMIHDSCDFYIHKDELDMLAPVILKTFQKQFDEFLGVKMSFELEIADFSKGEVWGFGTEIGE